MNVIMVVADEAALLESLRAVLPETDLILSERSVEDAMRRLISVESDVILLDDTSQLGQTALLHLREGAPHVPVIVLTRSDSLESQAEFTLAGAAGCIAKPFDCESLQATIEQAMNRRAPRRAEAFVHDAGAVPAQSTSRHRTALRWISRVSSYITDPLRLSSALADALTDIFGVARCAVLLDLEGVVRVTASAGLPENVCSSLKFEYVTGLMRFFEANICLADRTALQEDKTALKQFQVLGARLGAPLLQRGRLCGALLISEKSDGQEYSADERELLFDFSRCISTALENARLYSQAAAQESRLKTMVANLPSGVVLVKPDKTVAILNPGGERILRVRAEEVVGRSVQKLGSAFADLALRTLADGQPRLRQEINDAVIQGKLGVSATPLDDEGVVLVFSELPKEHASREELTYSPFWEYLAIRVAQEIKNPLVAVNTFTQLLPKKYDSEDFRTAFGEVVQKEVNRINAVVETLFEFARRPHLVVQSTSLNTTVQNVLRSFEEELKNCAIELSTELDPENPDANLDPIYFSQALHNVVQNSIDAMPKGGKLVIRTSHEPNQCEIVVSDTGPGISQHDVAHIFMPFYSTRERGMGLGLTMAARILQQHEGDLQLGSSPDGGSMFTLIVKPARESDGNNSGG